MDKLAKIEEAEITQTIDPMAIIKDVAMNNDIPVDKLTALFDLETRVQEREAKKEFTRAIAKFQHECPIITKGDSANGKPYARMDRIWSTIRPLIKECGLAITWESCTFNRVDKVCILDGTISHIGGYSKPIHSEVSLPDIIRGQNTAQVDGSAQTYAKRYATTGVLGIYMGNDDDGNGWKPETITTEQAEYLKCQIEQAGDQMPESRVKAMFDYAGCAELKDIPTAKYADCKKVVENARADKLAEEDLPK